MATSINRTDTPSYPSNLLLSSSALSTSIFVVKYTKRLGKIYVVAIASFELHRTSDLEAWVSRDGYSNKFQPVSQPFYLLQPQSLPWAGWTRTSDETHWCPNVSSYHTKHLSREIFAQKAEIMKAGMEALEDHNSKDIWNAW